MREFQSASKESMDIEQEAKERIRQLIHVDDTYDIVPMPLYKWVPCDPDLTQFIRNTTLIPREKA